jgi:citrate lyase subunit beta / citryl-CoA lyase
LTVAFRSLVFVPAHDEAALAAALASEADAVVADLEAATPAEAKALAREVVARAFAGERAGPARLVRVNELGSDLAAVDLELARGLDLDGLVVPQASAASIDATREAALPVIAVIESARGLREVYEIAARPQVQAVQLGANDLARDLGLESREDALELLHCRSRVVVDAVAAGVRSLFDRVLVGATAEELERDARFARSLGFTGKSTTTPGDAVVINRVFGRGAVA